MSSTGSEDWDFYCSSELDSPSLSSSKGSEESDLDKLYESFEFEEEVQQTRLQVALSDITQLALYPGSQITALQSYLLLFLFSI